MITLEYSAEDQVVSHLVRLDLKIEKKKDLSGSKHQFFLPLADEHTRILPIQDMVSEAQLHQNHPQIQPYLFRFAIEPPRKAWQALVSAFFTGFHPYGFNPNLGERRSQIPENKGMVRVQDVAATSDSAATVRRNFCFHNKPAISPAVMIGLGPRGATGTDASTSSSSSRPSFKNCGSAGGEMNAARGATNPPRCFKPLVVPTSKLRSSDGDDSLPRNPDFLCFFESERRIWPSPNAQGGGGGVLGTAVAPQMKEFVGVVVTWRMAMAAIAVCSSPSRLSNAHR